MSEWYLSRSGEQEGPFTAAQIGEFLSSGQLRASEAHAWKEGMAEWKTIAESGVLAEAAMSGTGAAARTVPTPSAQPVQQAQAGLSAAAPLNPYTAPSVTQAAVVQPEVGRYPGFGRLAYVGMQILLMIVLLVLVFIASAVTGQDLQGAGIATLLVLLVSTAGGIYIGLKRVQNLGMSGWAILWSFVPIMNIWIGWRALACPEGYEDHRQLDTAGKVITGLWIALIALAVLGNIVALAGGQ